VERVGRDCRECWLGVGGRGEHVNKVRGLCDIMRVGAGRGNWGVVRGLCNY
jgi:hypothetical protein